MESGTLELIAINHNLCQLSSLQKKQEEAISSSCLILGDLMSYETLEF